MADRSESVKVAVRVRPFNGREKDRNAKLIIQMVEAQTIITNPANGEDKKFTFDYSYQSHDQFHEDPARPGYMIADDGGNYADQQHVFDTLGADVLKNAYSGFNCSLFAYGQTGAGKSYSMVGYGVNKGIVPMTCDKIFEKIRTNEDPKIKYEVALSMLEIYNEAVRDLLTKTAPPKGGLKVRQHPKLGVQVVGLNEVAVNSYEEIDARIQDGTNNRTIAATNMNATSSRAHTVVAIMFKNVEIDGKGPGKDREMKSKINLVDLAGSERADSTGATGDRLKEGSAINLSLTMLGNVIKALAEKSNNPKSKMLVPYRDSKLTMILQDALGGNSKTIMIAALSPADINYEETLSTLRYADRAKQIKNKAIINIDPTELLIQNLKEENKKLMAALKASGGSLDALDAPTGATPEEIEEMRAKMRAEMEEEMRENMRLLEQNSMSFDERVNQSQAQYSEVDAARAAEEKRKAEVPHLMNLNEDPALSGMVVKFCDAGDTTVGKKGAEPVPDILLGGLSIQKQHAVLTNSDGKVSIKAFTDARVLVNGHEIAADESKELGHNDRVLFGANHMYVFVHPTERDAKVEAGDEFPEVTWELAQTEIARASGVEASDKPMALMTAEEVQKKLVQDDLIQIMPLVNEANLISQELDKKKAFEVKLWSRNNKTEVGVRMTDLVTQNQFLWPRETFVNRTFIMREMYAAFAEYGDDGLTDYTGEKDPFFESNAEVIIGTAYLQLNSLSYLIENEDLLAITDFTGATAGQLRVELHPSSESGEVEDYEPNFVEDPKELLGKRLDFVVRIPYARGLDSRFKKGSKCKFAWYLEEGVIETKIVEGTTNPEFAFEKHITVEAVTESLLEYLEKEALTIDVYGIQDDAPPSSSDKSTKELMQSAALGGSLGGGADLKSASKLAEVIKLFQAAVEAGEATGKYVEEMNKLLEL